MRKTFVLAFLMTLLFVRAVQAQTPNPTYIDFLRMTGRSAAPAGCTDGDIFYNGTTKTFSVCGTSVFGPALSATNLVGPGTTSGNYSSSGTWTFSQQVVSTVATGTAPFSIASTTVVPNLNAQLHGGLTAPASAILGLTDTQAPTNKTIDISLNTLKAATNTAGHYPRNNGTQYVDATIAGTDLPATASNCAGVQFAQGLNAGGTPVCAIPPTFVASGVSHAVGYVPDPGATAGTTRFLREDATWAAAAGGLPEAAFPCLGGGFAPTIVADPSAACTYVLLPSAHTLIRLTAFETQLGAGCTTLAVIAFRDETTATSLATVTVANGVAFNDSGALSVAMTAGDKFAVAVTTAAAGCTTNPNLILGAVYK